jgi:hypothetical protein
MMMMMEESAPMMMMEESALAFFTWLFASIVVAYGHDNLGFACRV